MCTPNALLRKITYGKFSEFVQEKKSTYNLPTKRNLKKKLQPHGHGIKNIKITTLYILQSDAKKVQLHSNHKAALCQFCLMFLYYKF